MIRNKITQHNLFLIQIGKEIRQIIKAPIRSTAEDVNGRPIGGSCADKLLDDMRIFGHFVWVTLP